MSVTHRSADNWLAHEPWLFVNLGCPYAMVPKHYIIFQWAHPSVVNNLHAIHAGPPTFIHDPPISLPQACPHVFIVLL
ncbi:hypothetical protein BS17DRAFT_331235 [Gyrodon lividus]|nr:hypothetical protein BS17DRAFT_331235 [Gyrodon lividus]